ncbi:MAG: Transposase [Mycobacterium sp.]|nr:Transposase [Mycobacterium sp.]
MLARLPLDLARRIRDSLQRQAPLGHKNYYGKVFETDLTELGIDLIRPTRSKEKPRPGQEFLKHCARSSSPSSTPSKDNSTSNATPAAPSPASAPASANASSP